jgi:hypothetical protein
LNLSPHEARSGDIKDDTRCENARNNRHGNFWDAHLTRRSLGVHLIENVTEKNSRGTRKDTDHKFFVHDKNLLLARRDIFMIYAIF